MRYAMAAFLATSITSAACGGVIETPSTLVRGTSEGHVYVWNGKERMWVSGPTWAHLGRPLECLVTIEDAQLAKMPLSVKDFWVDGMVLRNQATGAVIYYRKGKGERVSQPVYEFLVANKVPTYDISHDYFAKISLAPQVYNPFQEGMLIRNSANGGVVHIHGGKGERVSQPVYEFLVAKGVKVFETKPELFDGIILSHSDYIPPTLMIDFTGTDFE